MKLDIAISILGWFMQSEVLHVAFYKQIPTNILSILSLLPYKHFV